MGSVLFQQQQPETVQSECLDCGSPNFGDTMTEAYNLSAGIVKDRIKSENEGDVKILENATSDDIIVVQGTYDHIHNVLKAINIPFRHVTQSQLLQITLRPDQTVYVNCASSFPAEVAMKLADFVKTGGQLITTDWALKNVIEVAFPNTVAYNGKSTADECVDVEVIDESDEVVKGLVNEKGKDAKPIWWLEGSSYPIKVLNKNKVKVLVNSVELQKRYGEGAIIVKIEWGEGVVYHMISHFYLQRTETRDKKHMANASDYAMESNASPAVVDQLKTAKANYGAVQAATCSTEFVSRAFIKQKKKFIF